MKPTLFAFLICLGFTPVSNSKEENFADLDSPAHSYWDRPLKDPFSLRINGIKDGSIQLDSSSEKNFLLSLLEELQIPTSSQLLVFSTTSLQLSLISPRNPRAIYFNENAYVGFIPGGKIEVISMDPDLGGIFYIFEIPTQNPTTNRTPIRFERSDRCMNCHADTETRNVPGLTIRSVIPGPRGGSMDSFRRDQNGHQIPLDQRFGGWHVTSASPLEKHWGNVLGNYENGELVTTPLNPGTQFNFNRYVVDTSDILPHLLFEHQAGFVNLVLEATYRARFYTHENNGKEMTSEQSTALDQIAEEVVRYLLFADEAKLPAHGLKADPAYQAAFLKHRKQDADGRSLRDLNLQTRLFKHRCSYMIHSNVFAGLPEPARSKVRTRLEAALSTAAGAPDTYDYLPAEEKKAIQSILNATFKW